MRKARTILSAKEMQGAYTGLSPQNINIHPCHCALLQKHPVPAAQAILASMPACKEIL